MFSGRFKEVEVNNKKMLVDLDTSKLAWIVPWAVWLFPKNAYHYGSLKTDKEQKKKSSSKGLIVLTSSILASVLIRNTDKSFGELPYLQGHPMELLLCLIVLTAFVFYYRWYSSNRELKSLSDIKKYEIVVSKMTSGFINQLLKVCVGIFISIVALYFFGSIFIFKGNILGLGVYYFFLINILFRNYSEKIPETAKFSLKK
ncbi:DUF443 family protein [Enterococcus plantarum]|uniref:DUF443 family protein n=1 Tax=Enterococcus plantarum TaxID=1077675 RepID=UPI001AD3CB43|nr:DUF443 family protein [Enterococcus plantarum]MBO0421634.1 DUF443 family protein [Enterococcus plantarum]